MRAQEKTDCIYGTAVADSDDPAKVKRNLDAANGDQQNDL
jgi:hypothetical protein